MKLNTKLLIDRVVGAILVWMLLALRRTGRARPVSIDPDRIVVVKLMGLGSIIQASPLMATLRQRHPDARFVFLTKQGNDELTRRIALIDSTLTIDDSSMPALCGSLWRAIRELRRGPNTCIINLEAYSRLGTVITLLSGARWTAGFFRNPADLKLDRAFDFLVYFNAGAPISQVYLQLGRAIGAAELATGLTRLTTARSDHHEAEAALTGTESRRTSLVLVNPNASELRLERRWPAARFAQLISELLKAAPDCRVLLIGSRNEQEYTQDVYDQVVPEHRMHVSNLAGRVSLGALVALIGMSRLLVTNDSGPMHMAFSLGTPTVGLFGPVEPDHYSFAGAHAPHAALYHRIYCSPCVHHFDVAPCRGDNVCMKRISNAEVLNASLAILRAQPVKAHRRAHIVYTDGGRPLGVFGGDN